MAGSQFIRYIVVAFDLVGIRGWDSFDIESIFFEMGPPSDAASSGGRKVYRYFRPCSGDSVVTNADNHQENHHAQTDG